MKCFSGMLPSCYGTVLLLQSCFMGGWSARPPPLEPVSKTSSDEVTSSSVHSRSDASEMFDPGITRAELTAALRALQKRCPGLHLVTDSELVGVGPNKRLFSDNAISALRRDNRGTLWIDYGGA